MSNDSIQNESQQSAASDQECPAVFLDITRLQVTFQDQATDFMAVLLDRVFVKLMKGVIDDLSEDDKDRIRIVKETFLQKFRLTIEQTCEDLLDPYIQDLLEKIVETQKKVVESTDYMREICPIRSNFLTKLKGFKDEIDLSNETLSKERVVQHASLQDEIKATKVAKNSLIKRLRKVNQELVDDISNMSRLIRGESNE